MKVCIDGVEYVPAPPVPTGSILAALELRFDSDAGENITVREYLCTLLSTVWEERESFNGKRPFGNSGWEHELYDVLAKAGLVDLGPLDMEGVPSNPSREQLKQAHAYVHDLITAAMFGARG